MKSPRNPGSKRLIGSSVRGAKSHVLTSQPLHVCVCVCVRPCVRVCACVFVFVFVETDSYNG